ncbi:MAG: hypothetical protein ACRCTZ_13740 [Sarcina sp.]
MEKVTVALMFGKEPNKEINPIFLENVYTINLVYMVKNNFEVISINMNEKRAMFFFDKTSFFRAYYSTRKTNKIGEIEIELEGIRSMIRYLNAMEYPPLDIIFNQIKKGENGFLKFFYEKLIEIGERRFADLIKRQFILCLNPGEAK